MIAIIKALKINGGVLIKRINETNLYYFESHTDVYEKIYELVCEEKDARNMAVMAMKTNELRDIKTKIQLKGIVK